MDWPRPPDHCRRPKRVKLRRGRGILNPTANLDDWGFNPTKSTSTVESAGIGMGCSAQATKRLAWQGHGNCCAYNYSQYVALETPECKLTEGIALGGKRNISIASARPYHCEYRAIVISYLDGGQQEGARMFWRSCARGRLTAMLFSPFAVPIEKNVDL